MTSPVANYPWAQELEKTVVHSFVTTFGLDFLLFEDKKGGDVDTIYNVRGRERWREGQEGVWATKKEKNIYDDRGGYDSSPYHQHENYKAIGKKQEQQQEKGVLLDAYSGKLMGPGDDRDLDHVISAYEIHNDPGRILAEVDGPDIANRDSNLQATSRTVNRSKKALCAEKFLNKCPERIASTKESLGKQYDHLEKLKSQENTPQNAHKIRECESAIRKKEKYLKKMEEVDADAMRKRDKEARAAYDAEINQKYYSSSKFWKSTGVAAASAGFKMGARQALGLVLAEVWFELKAQLPRMLDEMRHKYSLEKSVSRVKDALKGIWIRVKGRLKDFLVSFMDGAFAGIMSSLMTTLVNIFFTTEKSVVKIIREVWGQLVKAIKLFFFNPDNLGFVDLCKAMMGIFSAAVSVSLGSTVHAQLAPMLSFPLGELLVSFASALVTGVATLGITYFFLYSEAAQKVWGYLEGIMPNAAALAKYQSVNTELDRYLTELAQVEFGMNTNELAKFAWELQNCNTEIERSLVLQAEVTKRDIELPYEMGNAGSTRKWLSSLAQ